MLNIDASLRLSFAPQVTPNPPPGARLFRIMWDFETDEYGGGVRPPENRGKPATMKSRIDHFTEMNEPLQMWLWEVWNIYAPAWMPLETRKEKWASFWHSNKAWTNSRNGSDYLADYINQTNLDQPPMRMESLASRGNVVMLHQEIAPDGKWLPFYATRKDEYLYTDPQTFARQWWMCHFATVQDWQKLPDGTYQVDRFPDFKHPITHETNDVPMPFLTRDGVIWLERAYVEEVGGRVNPYNPPRPFNPNL